MGWEYLERSAKDAGFYEGHGRARNRWFEGLKSSVSSLESVDIVEVLHVNILSPIFCFHVVTGPHYPTLHPYVASPSNHENTPRIFSLISMIVDYKKKTRNQSIDERTQKANHHLNLHTYSIYRTPDGGLIDLYDGRDYNRDLWSRGFLRIKSKAPSKHIEKINSLTENWT